MITTMLMHAGTTGHLHGYDFVTVAIFATLGVLSIALQVWRR